MLERNFFVSLLLRNVRAKGRREEERLSSGLKRKRRGEILGRSKLVDLPCPVFTRQFLSIVFCVTCEETREGRRVEIKARLDALLKIPPGNRRSLGKFRSSVIVSRGFNDPRTQRPVTFRIDECTSAPAKTNNNGSRFDDIEINI